MKYEQIGHKLLMCRKTNSNMQTGFIANAVSIILLISNNWYNKWNLLYWVFIPWVKVVNWWKGLFGSQHYMKNIYNNTKQVSSHLTWDTEFFGSCKKSDCKQRTLLCKICYKSVWTKGRKRCLDGNYWCNCMKKQGFKQVVKNLTQDTTYQQDSFSNF